MIENNDDIVKQLFTKHPEMHDDEVTEAAGSNRSRNDAVEQEFNVKWQMPGKIDLTTAKKQLLHLLTTLLVAFPNQITVIDHKKREWIFQERDNEETFEKELGDMAIQIHAMKTKKKATVRWIAVTTIRTTTTIEDWKDNDHFHANLNDMKTYVFPHPFKVEEWDIASIGFMKGVHAIHVPKQDLYHQLCHTIRHDQPNAQMPRFQLIPQRITTADKQATTKAFTVQCPKSEAQQLSQLLTHGSFRTSSSQMFVPFRFKTTKPEVYRQCIRQQNDIYRTTWIIKLEGITAEVLEVLKPEIMRIKGVSQIVATKRTQETGEMKILVEQTRCSYIHRQLSIKWPDLMQKIPTRTLANAPETFSAPRISSRKVYDDQYSDSDADSYGSLLTTGTENNSTEEASTDLDDLPAEYQYPSYAEVLKDTSTSTDSVPMSSPTASAYAADWQKEKQELEAQIQQQALRIQKQEEQIDKIQGDLEAKITTTHDLQERLAQALELAHTRDARHEEMMEKFELLMNYQATQQQDATQASFAVVNQETNQRPSGSPPPKKANTNASPARHVYSMFRQQSGGRQLTAHPSSKSKHFSARQSSSKTEVYDMETDEAIASPPPEVRPGKKTE